LSDSLTLIHDQSVANLPFQVLTTLAHRAKNQLIQETKQPLATQEQYLKTLLQHHRNTELGQHYHLEEIKTIDQFRSRLPILPYSAYGLKRSGEVPPPRLRILTTGSFDIVRQRQIDRGIPDSQLKFPHISEDRQLFTGLTVEKEVRLSEEQNQSNSP